MSKSLKIEVDRLRVEAVIDFVFDRSEHREVLVDQAVMDKVFASEQALHDLLDRGVLVYGVNTGFGDSCFRTIQPDAYEQLQGNLINYLLCGSGRNLSNDAARATFVFRLQSVSRGKSGVSPGLIDRMRMYLEQDWIPVIPSKGSLGASGDLVPLAYLANVLRGEGKVQTADGIVQDTEKVLSEHNLDKYRLKPKEGLALVNGTSAMAGQGLVNYVNANFLSELSILMSAWCCLGLQGRVDAYSEVVNDHAKSFSGQSRVAREIRELLGAEDYEGVALEAIEVSNDVTSSAIQDRYSLRCTPQILGPVLDTLTLVREWLDCELNSVADNPLIDQGTPVMGGNFYGGYIAHGMDYLKYCLGSMSDLLDRQLTVLVDEKSNRGLPPNLANWNEIASNERFLHHGLKGLHQSVSAITSEVIAGCQPSGLYSRSSESHNQDKVSLGMSAAMTCETAIDDYYLLCAYNLICLSQALDLREIKLKGNVSRPVYDLVRRRVPFIDRDRPLEGKIEELSSDLKELCREKRTLLDAKH